MRTIRHSKKKKLGLCLAYKIISFTEKCQFMNCSKVTHVETRSCIISFSDIWQKNEPQKFINTHAFKNNEK